MWKMRSREKPSDKGKTDKTRGVFLVVLMFGFSLQSEENSCIIFYSRKEYIRL